LPPAQSQKKFLVIIAVQAAFTIRLGHQSLSNNQDGKAIKAIK
jgi:hypothetical protein